MPKLDAIKLVIGRANYMDGTVRVTSKEAKDLGVYDGCKMNVKGTLVKFEVVNGRNAA